MEIVLGIVFLVGAIFLARLLNTSEQAEDKFSSPRHGAWQPRRPSRAPPSQQFDAGSARHQLEGRILSGRAWVTDGDTITISKTQVRLFGIDAPELNHPYGKQAKWALHKLCKGQVVRAEVSEEDAYGRTVAKCFLPDGRDLSAEMVKMGFAIDWAKFSGGCYKHLETPDARRRLYLADARQKGRMHVWEKFEARQGKR